MKRLSRQSNKIKDILSSASEFIKEKTETPLLDCEILLSEALKKDRTFIYAHPEFEILENQKELFFSYIERRNKFEPIAYILGKKEFYGREFLVDSRVLIPRPETEQLVDLTISSIDQSKQKSLTIVDICTGSGCVAISNALEINDDSKLSSHTFFGSDISLEALEVAKMNKNRLGGKVQTLKNLRFVQSDLLEYFIDRGIEIDILTANPPYISDKDYIELEPQIKKWEPGLALKSGSSENVIIDLILKQIGKLKKKPDFIFIEGKDGEIFKY